MKNTLLIASLLAVMTASAVAQTPAAVTAKPSAAPAARAPVSRMPDPVQMAKAQIARFDTNRDGKVSTVEFLKPATARFNRIDRNNDGFVTEAELTEFGKRQMAEVTKHHAKNTQPASPGLAVKPPPSENPSK